MEPEWQDESFKERPQNAVSSPTTNPHLSEEQQDSFPWKLRQLLNDVEKSGCQCIVSWSLDGNSFQVYERMRFVKQVLPLYFRQNSFKSFQRQLYLYSFKRIHNGKDKGGYFHPFFRKYKRESTLLVQRISKGKAKKSDESALKTNNGTSNDLGVPRQPQYDLNINWPLPPDIEPTKLMSNQKMLLEETRSVTSFSTTSKENAFPYVATNNDILASHESSQPMEKTLLESSNIEKLHQSLLKLSQPDKHKIEIEDEKYQEPTQVVPCKWLSTLYEYL